MHKSIGLIQDQTKPVARKKSIDIDITIEDFEGRFRTLQKGILRQLVESSVDTLTVINSLTLLPVKLRKEYEKAIQELPVLSFFSNNESINKLFFHLNPLFSFLDYGLLEYIIKSFGNKILIQDMTAYSNDMCIFMKETTIKQLIDHLPGQTEIPPKFSLIEAKIGQNASECTLEQLNRIRKRYCSEVKLSEIVFHLVAVVESNSFIVRWLVPSALVLDIMKSTRNVDQSFYQEYKITSLTLDGTWLFLNESEIDTMWSQVHLSGTKIIDQFHTMHKQIIRELKMGEISAQRLSLYLMDQRPKIGSYASVLLPISEAFLKHDFPLSFIDFRILAIIIEKFGSDCLKRVMKSYCKYISVYTMQATAQQLITLVPVPSKPSDYFIAAECRIIEEPSDYRLEKLFSFQTKFCTSINFNKVCFAMDEIYADPEKSGSFIIKWLIPSVVVPDFMKSARNVDQHFYQEYKITFLTLDGMWLFISESEIDVMWSQWNLSDTKLIDQFYTMHKQIIHELKMRGISEQKLLSYLIDQCPKIGHCASVLSKAFLKHDFPLSFIDFRILSIITEKFGSDCLKMVMKSYCKYISVYTMQATAQQVIDLPPVQSKTSKDFTAAECRIMEEPSDYRLEKLFRFQTKFCTSINFNKVCFAMDEIYADPEKSGSFIVKWLIPSVAVYDFMKSARNVQRFCQEYKITSLTLDGMWLFLSESEIGVMWSQGNLSDTKLIDQFYTMHKQIIHELKMRGISEQKLSSYLIDQRPKIGNCASVLSMAFLKRDVPLSFIDFRILSIITEKFGSDCLKRVMKSYCKYISVYTMQATAQQVIDLPPVQSKTSNDFIASECRIMEEPSDYRLEKLLSFQTKFCTSINFNKVCFAMDEIYADPEKSGSFIVKWLIPSVAVYGFMKSARNVQRFCQEYKITSLTLDGMWLFLSESEIGVMWSQGNLSDTKLIDQFYTMHKQIIHELKMGGRSELKLFSYLIEQHPKIGNCASVLSKAFLKRDVPLSFIDFRILSIITEKFGSDCLKRVMKSYCKYISVYTMQATAQQVIDLPPVQSKTSKDFIAAECRIMEEPSDYRLEKLLSFQTIFCASINFNKVCFAMDEIYADSEKSDSFIIKWLMPSAAVPDFMKSARNVVQSFYQEYKITSLTLDGMWLFLSESEIDVMWSQGNLGDTKLIDRFHTMHKQILHELKMGEISEQNLSSYLMDQRPEIGSYASVLLPISEAFLKHDFPLSFIDFRILAIIIEKFGSDCLKRVMKSYSNYISIYAKHSTIQQLIALTPVQSKRSNYFVAAECRIMGEPSDYRLEKLLNFKTKFCSALNFNKACFVMDEISKMRSGSFTVSWHIPSSLAVDLLKSTNRMVQTELFQEVNIASLSIYNGWMYHYQLTPFGTKLKKKYQQSQGSPSPVEWIPSPTKKIFRLAMIQRERVQRGHIEDRFVQMTISGRVDDILHAKSPVELEHIFRDTLHGGEIILIEGAPGSGKSTLTVHICQRWSKGELFQQFTVVILVQLRDPEVQRAQTIADLLPVENAQELATELTATNGRGVLWVLDGWDELPPHLQQYSIFRELIERMHSECSVIVTSRPISSGDLHPVVSSRIEVLGFTPEEQRQYLTECLKGDTKALEALLEKIQENPLVQSICYLPLNAAFIVHTFKYRGQSLPNTEYEIYVSVILSCNQRHFEREGKGHNLPRELASLDDLSRNEVVREPFQCLCELAYHGVMKNKVTFSSSDLPQGSNTLSLLQAIESFLQSGKSVFYNFLHLSIQEVLSAYYIATCLSDSEQVSRFQQLFNQPRFAAVFQFYAAITKLKSPGIRQVIDRIVKAKSKPLLVSLLRCLHEAQDPSLCRYVAEQLELDVIAKMHYVELDLSGNSLSPLDCLSVSYFLSSTGMTIKGNFSKCSIGDLGARSLVKYLHDSVDHVGKVTIYLLVSDNDIHEEGASHIARTVNFIEHLDLSHNTIRDTGASLSEAISATAMLKTLILYECLITSRGAKDLSRALAQNSSLEKLDIGNNSLGDEGISHVAKGLMQNKQLKELWISNCGMTDNGAASLAGALRVNNSLKMLHMGGSKGALTGGGLSVIARSLGNNSELVKLAISGDFDFITGHLSQDINEARKEMDSRTLKLKVNSV